MSSYHSHHYTLPGVLDDCVLLHLSYMFYLYLDLNSDFSSSSPEPYLIPCRTAEEVDVLLAYYSSIPDERNTDTDMWGNDPYIICDMYGFNVFDPEGKEVWLESDIPLLQQQIEDHYDCPWVQDLLESHEFIGWGEVHQLDDGSWTHIDPTDTTSVTGVTYTSYSNPATARPKPVVAAGSRW